MTKDPYILANLNTRPSRWRVPKIKSLYFRNDLRQLQIHSSNTCNNALHYLTLIKMIVARFVGTGFLITYSNGHMGYSTSIKVL